MTSLSLPNLNQVGTNEWEDVEGNDRAIRDFLNSTGVGVYQAGSIQNAAIAAGAGISYSKLASMPTGAILLGNAGVPTATTMGGDATIGATGTLTIAALAVTNAKMAAGAALANLASGSVTDAKLASPNNSAYRTVVSANGFLADTGSGNPAAATYILGSSGGGAGMRQDATDRAVGSNDQAPLVFRLTAADRDVAGLTQKLRLRAQIATNGTAPGVDVKVGLYPAGSGGAADQIRWTAGSLVTGSQITFTTPPSGTISQDVTADFSAPSDDVYMLAVVVAAGGFNNNAAASVHAQLQFRNV